MLVNNATQYVLYNLVITVSTCYSMLLVGYLEIENLIFHKTVLYSFDWHSFANTHSSCYVQHSTDYEIILH